MKNRIRMSKEKIICVILAGGYAHRLFPLTNNMAKTLLPIAGTSSLEMIIKKIEKIPAIEKIVLLVNTSRREEISKFVEKYLGKTKEKNTKIGIFEEPPNETKEEWGPMRALDYYYNKYDEPNYSHRAKDHLIIGGDNIFDFDLNKFLKHIEKHKKNMWIAVYDKPPKDRDIDIREVGTADIDKNNDNKIICFYEKNETKKCAYIATACYYIPHDKLHLVNNYVTTEINNRGSEEIKANDNLGKFISFIISDPANLVLGYPFKEKWLDIGLRETLLAANAYVLEKTRPKTKNKFANVTFNKPILISDNCKISKSDIGPDVYIAESCVINNCEIRNSIIMQNTTITNSVIKNSIIGPNSKIVADIHNSVFGPQTQCYGPRTRKDMDS